MGRFYLVVAVTSVVGAIIGQADLLYFGVIAMLVGFLAVSISIASTALYFVRPSNRMRVVPALQVSSAIAIGAFLSALLAIPVLNALVRRSEAWCENVIPAIEQYRVDHGAYPGDLSALRGVESSPWFFAPRYVREGESDRRYSLVIPISPFSGREWSSDRRTWEELD